ncbi:MAG: GNAT family N-acetyltransferase [Thermoplasmata archaeon]|nr:GNAT family N-acetyltransferase [Thermoplasmata archaeon]
MLVLNAPLTGLDEDDAVKLLAPRGFRPFHRYGLAISLGGPLPPERAGPVTRGRLRTLSPTDSEALSDLSARCYADSAERFLFGTEFESRAAARAILKSFFEGAFGTFVPEASFGLDIDGTLMGATLVTRRPTHYLLADVEVHPAVQGQGHARRLIRATMEALSAETERPLGLSVTQENRVAFRLYRDLGFVVRQGPTTFWADTDALSVSPPTLEVGALSGTALLRRAG